MYTCTHAVITYIQTCIYIYIYIEREREEVEEGAKSNYFRHCTKFMNANIRNDTREMN